MILRTHQGHPKVLGGLEGYMLRRPSGARDRARVTRMQGQECNAKPVLYSTGLTLESLAVNYIYK